MNFLTLYVLFTLHIFIKLIFGTFLDITPLYTFIMLLCISILYIYSPLFIIYTYVALDHDYLLLFCIFLSFLFAWLKTKSNVYYHASSDNWLTKKEQHSNWISQIFLLVKYSVYQKKTSAKFFLNFKQTCHKRS